MDVDELLRRYLDGEECVVWLANLTPYAETPSSSSKMGTLQTIEGVAEVLQWGACDAEDLVRQRTQLWKTGPYPMMVLFEALQSCDGYPICLLLGQLCRLLKQHLAPRCGCAPWRLCIACAVLGGGHCAAGHGQKSRTRTISESNGGRDA